VTERELMELAVEMAAKCEPPDPKSTPKVGAVIAIDGEVVSSASRGRDDHAEKIALRSAPEGADLSRAVVYTTLEPCTHHVRRGELESCTDRLVGAKVDRVVVGILDPNQGVCGRGITQLQQHRIEVVLFPKDLAQRVSQLNADFIRAQQSLDVRIVDPPRPGPGGALPRFPIARCEFMCECTNEPGDDVYAFAEKEGFWWPQPDGLVWREKNRYAVNIHFGARGVHVIHIVRANELGRRLVEYYRDIVGRQREQDEKFSKHFLAKKFRGLLNQGFPGFRMGTLPHGLNSLDSVQVDVAP